MPSTVFPVVGREHDAVRVLDRRDGELSVPAGETWYTPRCQRPGPQAGWQRGSDRRRDKRLVQLGPRVLRLEAQLVLRDIEAAVERVRDALG
jgi:hypothetical protein